MTRSAASFVMTTGQPTRRRLAGGALFTGAVLSAALLAGGGGVAAAATTSTTGVAGGSANSGSASTSSPYCTPATVDQVRQTLEGDLSARVSQLNLLVSRVNEADALIASDKSALLDDLTQTEQTGIQALVAKVPSDSTCAELRQDAHSMVWNYRVYLVMTPQTDLVIATDAALVVDAKLSSLETAISNRITNAQQHGHDVTGAQQAFSDYENQVSAIQSLLSGQAAAVLAVTPAGYPGDGPTLQQAKVNLQNARTDFRTARTDLATIRSDLS